jgi:hypothetical protein
MDQHYSLDELHALKDVLPKALELDKGTETDYSTVADLGFSPDQHYDCIDRFCQTMIISKEKPALRGALICIFGKDWYQNYMCEDARCDQTLQVVADLRIFL